jgi:hypothetical protein
VVAGRRAKRGGGGLLTRPEDALARARAEAERRRAAGGYREDSAAVGELADEIAGPVTLDQLREWALIEVDTSLVRSTRRGGGPVTAVKRLLLRLLRQYTNELEAQQTRFNVAVLARLEELEQRIAERER